RRAGDTPGAQPQSRVPAAGDRARQAFDPRRGAGPGPRGARMTRKTRRANRRGRAKVSRRAERSRRTAGSRRARTAGGVLMPTSTIGSFPKPERLKQARADFARGDLDAGALRRIEEEATIECLRLQEDLGLDLLVDGEMYRCDMTTYFAEHLEGFRISGLVRSYGNRYYRKPIVVGPVRWKRPVTRYWFRFAP